MNRDFYTFGHLIMGLRKEYLKNYRILKNLESLIEIEDKDVTSYKISNHSSGPIYGSSKFKLEIFKKQKLIIETLQKLNVIPIKSFPDNLAMFDIEKIDFNYVLKQINILNNCIFKPGVNIANQDEFNMLCEIIFSSKTLALSPQYSQINIFQYLYLNDTEISLSTLDKMENTRFDLKYCAETDTFVTISPKNKYYINPQDLLRVEIPKNRLHPHYISLMEESRQEPKNFIMVGQSEGKKAINNYSIEDKQIAIVLNKIK